MTWIQRFDRTRRSSVMALLAVYLLAVHGSAQQAPAAPSLPDVQKLGPQAGDRVPDFALNDQHGQSRTLTSLLGAKGLVLVFYRSADW
jgi:cytochrome oxidase Cu insertion factor (SCO1/SenC/PrrC family)